MQHNQILRFNQIRELTGLSKSTIDRLERAGKFPKRIKIGPRAIGWVQKEVDRFINEKLGSARVKGGNQ